MNRRMELVEVAARAICRVELNDCDPDDPAVRWNGTQCEPQDFPVWQDFRDEARAVIAALQNLPGVYAHESGGHTVTTPLDAFHMRLRDYLEHQLDDLTADDLQKEMDALALALRF